MIIEGEFTKFVKDNWETLGLTPIFLKLMVEFLNWSPDIVEDTFGHDDGLVGADYADIKMTEWVKRLCEWGYKFPDGKPVLQTLNEILIEHNDYANGRFLSDTPRS